MNIIIVGGRLACLLTGLALKGIGHNVHILGSNPEPLLEDQDAGIIAGTEIRDYMQIFDKSRCDFVIESVFRHYLDIQGSNFDGVKSEYCKVPDQAGGNTIYDYDANVIDMKVENDEVTLVYEQENKKKNEKASSSLASTLVERFTLFHVPGTQILAYVIPGKHGKLKQGYRLINWVWYFNCENLSKVLTDCDGKTHRWPLPQRKVNVDIWENQKQYASNNLPPQFVELINKTQPPFVQAITDVPATQAIHFDGRVVLVGDALAGFRPHTVASTSQAAFHASQLCESMRSWDEWVKKQSLYEDTVMEFARLGNKVEQQLGNVSQFGHYEIGGKMRMAPPSIR
ncbi:unnamed protein product [Rotaria socialis]|uniref:2,6-dihydroxypyridine 3-monooxygenase substrate binding domain-containing protein n=1 Tax=Rotaria socialis TaxID=392032 RepID=A0A820H282_9BILA|nr:unnamed protein product [Rotaria socialis]